MPRPKHDETKTRLNLELPARGMEAGRIAGVTAVLRGMRERLIDAGDPTS